MQYHSLADYLPLWGMFLVTAAIILSSLEGGFRFGRWRLQRHGEEKERPVGAMVGAMLGLVAFMLAFTFGMASSRFDARKQALLDEVNAIRTAYHHAGLLKEPHRTEIQNILREYVAVRLEGVRPGKLEASILRSEQLHDMLWAQAISIGQKPDSIGARLYTQSLNDLVNQHTRRVTASLSRIPDVLWIVLYAIAVTGMAGMGYHTGLTGSSRSFVALGLALTFSAVLFLIVDLDRPQQGFLEVSQQAMEDLRNRIGVPKP